MTQINYTLNLDEISCTQQTDWPELTENDEIFFVVSTTKVQNNWASPPSVVTYPSNQELTIASGQKLVIKTPIASGSLVEGETVLLNVAMWENDESSLAHVVSIISSVIGQAIPSGPAQAASQLAPIVAGAMQTLSQGRGNPFLGNFVLQIEHHGFVPYCSWIPGPGLRTLPPFPPFGFPLNAGWNFENYSTAKYWASFFIAHAI